MKNYNKDPRFNNSEDLSNFMKSFLLEKMKEYGIDSISAEYDGSGDDGNMEYPVCEGERVEEFLELDVVSFSASRRSNSNGMEFVVKEFQTDMETFILDYFCFPLERKFGGWEINEGSFGKLTLTKDGGFIEHNQRVVDIEYNEESF